MAAVKFTQLTGLAASPNPKYTLLRIYGRISKLLEKMPENAAYRKNVQTIISERTTIVNSTDDIKEIEKKIGSGMVEELIIQARNELNLAQRFLLMRPWESLTTPIPKNQWQWPVK